MWTTSTIWHFPRSPWTLENQEAVVAAGNPAAKKAVAVAVAAARAVIKVAVFATGTAATVKRGRRAIAPGRAATNADGQEEALPKEGTPGAANKPNSVHAPLRVLGCSALKPLNHEGIILTCP